MTKKRIFSGIQPSGNLHLGNYLGSLNNWKELQNEYDSIFSIVNLHAITVPQDPEILRKKTLEVAAIYLACGIDPKKSHIFIQSEIKEHTELMWILNTIAYIGEIKRMTQFKDKSSKFKNENIPLGIFNYPILMAADILLYDTDLVPVGDDQKQHVELSRNLAIRFNNKFGNTFKVPEPFIQKDGARIMGLDDPEKKMSKSALSIYNYISLLDSNDNIIKKIKKATTDSEKNIVFDKNRKGLYNLLSIYKILSKKSEKEIEKEFYGKGYGDFKKDLSDLIIEIISPIREKTLEYLKEKNELNKILSDGKIYAQNIATIKIQEVKNIVGLK